MIDSLIAIALVFALQLLCFFCGYVSGIRRGRAMELKRWRRHRPPLPEMTSDTTFVYLSHYPRPDWSPCSQPPNDPSSEP